VLTPGTRLGPYEIQTPIGAGGMGEVYKARDTRLDRTVAIKILPDALATDPRFRERFDREARAISQLDHPHICALHDVGEQNGTAYLVMQYLDGETLAERLAKGALPLDQALRYAIEIADALDKAHSAGIVHRDLKPSNIKLTAAGAKLLDFGLAKTAAPLIAGTSSMAPTTPAGLTAQGTILGTLQYMAPEQLEGLDADARTDVFAFGAVLYEMVTGARAFQGGSQASLVGAILKDAPKPMSSAQPLTPPALERVTSTCLEKRPDDRWQSMRDLARELKWIARTPKDTASPVVSLPPQRSRLAWSVAIAALLAAAAATAWGVLRTPSATASITRLGIALPVASPYVIPTRPSQSLAIAPDGRQVVYVGVGRSDAGSRRIRVLLRRSFDQPSVNPIPGTDGAYQPFLSPDGKSVAFFVPGGELKRIPLDGGPGVTIARGIPNPQWNFGTWRDDDIIVFGTFDRLMQVPAGGGTPTQLLSLGDGPGADLWHHFPVVVPSTGDIIFTVYTSEARFRLDILRWDTKSRSTLVENASAPILTASGHLLFGRDDRVMAAPFDASRRSVGAATPLPESVVMDQFGVAQLAISRTGTLVYVAPDPQAPVPSLGWMTRAGAFTDVGAVPAGLDWVSLSPDGTQALASSESRSRVAIIDLARGVSTPVALGSRPTESATWHPDGKRITLGGAYLSLFDPDTGNETRLTPIGRPKRFASWAPDGRRVAYHTYEPTNDVYWLALKENSSELARGPSPLGGPRGPKGQPAIAPDGRWVAYRGPSDDGTGRQELYLARFPEGTGRVQVTRSGGGIAFWSRKGDELFFQGPPAGELYRVPVMLSAERAQVGAPQALFKPDDNVSVIAASPDGTRFLAIKEPRTDPPREIVVVEHWLDDLRRAVPVP
jgi:serine/threonine-protein kinase